MSESEKRTPISVYLTPKAAAILREYNMGSGYGSLSRTVEEIILALDFVYSTVNDTAEFLKARSAETNRAFTNQEKVILFLALYTQLTNIMNALSRLGKESPPIT